MSTAVFTMEMPESCEECRFMCGFAYYGQFLCSASGNWTVHDPSWRPDWCPLKTLPGKNRAPKVADGYELGYEDGWNKCLEKIAGGNER